MRRMICLTIVLTVALWGASCRRTDPTTVEIDVPELKNEDCARIIRTALIKEQNIELEDVDIDVLAGTVKVKYDTMQRALKNLEITIANAGFQANEVPANQAARAKLPPECLE